MRRAPDHAVGAVERELRALGERVERRGLVGPIVDEVAAPEPLEPRALAVGDAPAAVVKVAGCLRTDVAAAGPVAQRFSYAVTTVPSQSEKGPRAPRASLA